jgi:hypothetical protein
MQDLDKLLTQAMELDEYVQELQRQRREVACAIAQLLSPDLKEGQRTTRHGAYKVTVKLYLNRSVDFGALRMLASKAGIPEDRLPIRVKAEVAGKALQEFKASFPADWQQVAGAFTEKPGMPQVVVERKAVE